MLYLSLIQLNQMMPHAKAKRLGHFLHALNRAMVRYEISTPLRIAHFVTQVGHESGNFQYTEEIWPHPQLDERGIATHGNRWQKGYEGHKGLGNTEVGDGYRFRGRGLFHLRGRTRYSHYQDHLQKSGYPLPVPLTEQPELVAQPELAVDSAGWFWRYGCGSNLNTIADQDDITKLTRRIHRSPKGLEDRKARLVQAKRTLDIL